MRDFPCKKITKRNSVNIRLNTPSWTCYKDFSHIGNLTYEDVSLYDLSSDVSESYDLFTEDGRFHAKALSLYNKLVTAAEDMAHPMVYWEAKGEPALTRKVSSDGVTLEWTPFVKEGQGKDYRDYIP